MVCIVPLNCRADFHPSHSSAGQLKRLTQAKKLLYWKEPISRGTSPETLDDMQGTYHSILLHS